ncbi:unnamed protein product [Trifolium pratense]|uniref:Uncharacterized protein n=1 Tax=Trifolium pratense TaxID=57577 RepID=A0ACB0KNZ1_TRIPR|nr:unnamed protein product [Trifolium pratense]
MASSNRHWPSMFKSKPCNTHHQWQHDINSSLISSSACHRTPYSGEERSAEPKPRWNPKPEQIRILEAIFNSGMVNPPREEIRKIRAQLQEYGQVGDANVFYWFQNRKSRSKHKLRHLQNQNSKNQNQNQNQNLQNQEHHAPQQNSVSSLSQITTAPSSSSSSSEKSPPKELIPSKVFSLGFTNINDVVPNSPTASVNQNYFHPQNETNLLPTPQVTAPTETFFFPMQNHVLPVTNNVTSQSQGFCFSELSNMVHHQPQQNNTAHCTAGILLSEIMNNHGATNSSKKEQVHHDKNVKIMHQTPHFNFCFAPSTTTVAPPTSSSTITVPSPIISQLQGIGEVGVAAKSMVFINDVAFEVASGPFNVRQAFGDDAILINSTGQPVLTNQWGVTLHSLQHGACYYVVI